MKRLNTNAISNKIAKPFKDLIIKTPIAIIVIFIMAHIKPEMNNCFGAFADCKILPEEESMSWANTEIERI